MALREDYVVLEHVTRRFSNNGGELVALSGVSLTVRQGEFISIVGGSGCGKSTLLRAIAGIDPDYEGRILVKGEEIRRPGKARGIIFQEHRLFPWLTAEGNVKYALNGISRAEKRKIAEHYLELVGLTGFEKSYPKQLSGGMAQRAGIARALANDPEFLLLDEPFGALDAFTKMQMQNEIDAIKRKYNSTMILVTHDIEEAVFLADRVVVLSPRPGTIQKIFPVNLPRRRQRNNTEFIEIRRAVYNELFTDNRPAADYSI
ncbi:MAG: ABC transporter ATP-binding protein [Gracilibacteraceae bacterium]|jgi:sulfonate transport system ATP-binding protein|nr:ABC transporter ATP-binding protein [Gracilibacteraceae bacterium]